MKIEPESSRQNNVALTGNVTFDAYSFKRESELKNEEIGAHFQVKFVIPEWLGRFIVMASFSAGC